jgi:hypothetical protein
MRSASDSTRRRVCATSSWLGVRPSRSCRRRNSAYPRIEASGVRSSWLASATNWRTWVSDSCRAASDCSTWSSSRLSAVPTRPTSVRVSVSSCGTRSGSATSPLASGSSVTRVAVAATCESGRSVRRTTMTPVAPATRRPASPAMTSTRTRLVIATSEPCSGSPVTRTSPSGARVAMMRYVPRLPERSTLCGWPSGATWATASCWAVLRAWSGPRSVMTPACAVTPPTTRAPSVPAP